ncbi:MAG: biotin/lipoyl-binding protein, partial [Saprospiraceae bacterium]|nr:biotin/lipoyl-binding protein [Saprospiraceae bacterium]
MNKGCLIAGAVFFGVVSIALGYYFYQQGKKDPVVHEFVAPELSDIVKKTVATGSIKPRQEVNIKPQVSGIVEEIFVEEGAIVKKGQEVAKIKLVPSPVSINNAESQVELARIRYQEATRELERQEEVFEKSLDIQESAASYENAKKEEERQSILLDDGVISEQEYNRFQLDLDIRRAAYENARILARNNLKRFESDADIRQQELNAAITNLQLLREGASRKYRQLSNIIESTVEGMVLDV